MVLANCPDSDCLQLVGVLINFVTMLVTGAAAFFGAFFAFWFSKYQKSQEEFDRKKNLLGILVSECSRQIEAIDWHAKERNTLDRLCKEALRFFAERASNPLGDQQYAARYFNCTRLHKQREAFQRINDAMVIAGPRSDIYDSLGRLDHHLSNLEQHYELLEERVLQNSPATMPAQVTAIMGLNAQTAEALVAARKEVVKLKELGEGYIGKMRSPDIFSVTKI